MDEAQMEKILNSPEFKIITKKKTRFAVLLTVIVCIAYYGLILLIAFKPEIVATTISPQSVISYGLPLGVGVILLAIVLTGIYTWRSNTYYDKAMRKLIEEQQ